MCYMVRASQAATEVPVGVRELRQNLSVYLERVAAGTVFRVTDRGRAVALLVPLPAHATAAERLVASGRAAPPTGDVLALGRPTVRPRTSLTEALRQVREDRL
jgi:prevent-host-death family protein